MGSWSGEIFGNDLVCDVRDAYREQIKAGDKPAAAAKHVRKAFAEEMQSGALEKWTVWIALAAAQSLAGKISDDVRANALKAINWCEGPGAEDCAFKLKPLSTLRKKLGGTEREPRGSSRKTATPNSLKKTPPGKKGDVLALKLPNSDSEVVIVIVGECDDRPSDYARVALLRGLSPEKATAASVKKALKAWRLYREDWGDRLGVAYGLYEANGKFPRKSARLLMSGIEFPPEFASRVRVGGPIEPARTLPYVVEHALWQWKNGRLKLDPAHAQIRRSPKA